jgi:hypothetical protein
MMTSGIDSRAHQLPLHLRHLLRLRRDCRARKRNPRGDIPFGAESE